MEYELKPADSIHIIYDDYHSWGPNVRRKKTVSHNNETNKRDNQLDLDKKEMERYVFDVAEKLKQKYRFEKDIYFIAVSGEEELEKKVQKLKNAIDSYANLKDDELPVFCYDSTVTGTARDGLLASNKALYVHNYKEDTVVIPYSLGPVIEYRSGFLTDSLYAGNIKLETPGMSKNERIAYCNMLNETITTFKQPKKIEWFCPCGEKNRGNFCTRCGKKRQS